MGDERNGRNPLDELRQVLGSPYGIDDFTDVPAAACWPAIPSADAAAEWARHVDADVRCRHEREIGQAATPDA